MSCRKYCEIFLCKPFVYEDGEGIQCQLIRWEDGYSYRHKKGRFYSLFNALVWIGLFYFSSISGCNNEDKTSLKIKIDEASVLNQVSGEKSEIGAIFAANRFVANRLEFPKAAQFPGFGVDVAKHTGDLYLVNSYVETRKDCGPKERIHFTCLLRFEKDVWILEMLEFY